MNAIQLQLSTPYVTYEEYARITGLPYNTVKRMVADGRIPLRPKSNPKEKPLINLVALHQEATHFAGAEFSVSAPTKSQTTA